MKWLAKRIEKVTLPLIENAMKDVIKEKALFLKNQEQFSKNLNSFYQEFNILHDKIFAMDRTMRDQGNLSTSNLSRIATLEAANYFIKIEELKQTLTDLSLDMTSQMNGLNSYVRERLRIAQSAQTDVDLLKKLAKLEEVHDAVEHRRSSAEIIARRDQIASLQAQADHPEVLEECVDLLNWVLGADAT